MNNMNALEVNQDVYAQAKSTVLNNGGKLWEHSIGTRRNMYSDGVFCATTSDGDYLPLNKNITRQEFAAFLGMFKRNLLMQFKKNETLYDLNITFTDVTRDKNYEMWNKMNVGDIFYIIDLNSAYWQMAHKLGYITNYLFQKYLDEDKYKEAKRYCISFLARTNKMVYFDGRQIDTITCNVDSMIKVYDNIRNSLYQLIYDSRMRITDWIEYNIDAITVMQKDVPIVANAFDEINFQYKLKKCVKTDEFEYMNDNGTLRKF